MLQGALNSPQQSRKANLKRVQMIPSNFHVHQNRIQHYLKEYDKIQHVILTVLDIQLRQEILPGVERDITQH